MLGPENNIREIIPMEAARLRQIIDAAAVVLVMDGTGIVLEANARFYQTTGFLPSETLERDFVELNNACFSEDFAVIWQKVLAGDVWEGEGMLQTKNRTPYWCSTTLVPLTHSQGTDHVAFVGFDVTHYKEREGETKALWLHSNFWLERVKQQYLADRKQAVATGKPLSLRESQVLRLVAEGLANKNIASQLNISVRTVEIHRAHVMKKLGLKTTAALVKYAIERGYTTITS